jgi:predicted MFS family arabinose efflux permease
MYRSPFMWRLGLSYLLFGFANLMFFTFITAALIGEKGFSSEGAGEFMALDGLLSIAGAVLWGALSDRGNRRRILAGALLLAGTAYVMFALGQGVIILVAAEVLKCLTVGGVAALTLTLAAEKSGRPLAAAGMGMITAFLGVGQTLGPPAGGFIIDQTGSYAPMLLAAAGITILAAVNMALPEASAGRSTIPKK